MVHGSQGFLAAALGTLVYTALDQGTVDAELEAFASAFVREQARRPWLQYSHAMHAGACLRVHRGEWSGLPGARRRRAGASCSGARATRPSRPGARPPPWSPTSSGTCAPRGRLALEEVDLARAFGAPRALGIALRAAGLVAEREQGIALLAEAVAVLDRSLGALDTRAH